MRNLLTHPLTQEELIRILEGIKQEIEEERKAGDIRPAALGKAIELVRNSRM